MNEYRKQANEQKIKFFVKQQHTFTGKAISKKRKITTLLENATGL